MLRHEPLICYVSDTFPHVTPGKRHMHKGNYDMHASKTITNIKSVPLTDETKYSNLKYEKLVNFLKVLLQRIFGPSFF